MEEKLIQNLNTNKVLWLLTSVLALIAASVGFAHSSIYDQVVSSELMPGIFSQDLITIIISLIAIVLIVGLKEDSARKQITILGMIGYFFYGYGILVIEQLYTPLYFVYMAIFSLSTYSIIYSVISLKGAIPKFTISKNIRVLSVVFLVIVPLVFIPLWSSQIIPLIQSGEKLEFLFSVYILDLCFLMPLFVLTAIKTARNTNVGLLLAPALLFVGFMVLVPLPLGELVKPLLFNMSMDTGGLALFLILSMIFITLAIVNLVSLKIKK